MITNAMWFKGGGEGEEEKNQKATAIKLGPVSFTLAQVSLDIDSDLYSTRIIYVASIV